MSDDTVAFLGAKTVTPEEVAQLRLLGGLLAEADGELHTSMSEGANLAVITGFRNRGKQPILHTSKLHEASPWVLLYGDDHFIDAILLHWPNPKDTRHWDHVNGLEELKDLNRRIRAAIDKRKANPA